MLAGFFLSFFDKRPLAVFSLAEACACLSGGDASLTHASGSFSFLLEALYPLTSSVVHYSTDRSFHILGLGGGGSSQLNQTCLQLQPNISRNFLLLILLKDTN